MEVILTEPQKQVDSQIEARLSRICRSEWNKVNVVKGRKRKRTIPITYSNEIKELLALRQDLYNGRDPEEISAIICNGEIQNKFLKA